MKTVLLVLTASTCLAGASAYADETGIARRAAMERQQQSDNFAVRVEQSQHALRAAPADHPALEALHQDQVRRLESLREENERRAELSRIRGIIPGWGPTLEVTPRHTPTLERPRPPWTPTLQ